MLRPQIKFKNGHSLAFQDQLLAVLEQSNPENAVRRLAGNGVSAIILCCSPGERERHAAAVGNLERAAAAGGVDCTTFDWNDAPADPEKLQQLARDRILPGLKAGHVICLFAADHSSGFERLAAQLLMVLPTPYGSDPEQVVQYLLKRAPDHLADRNIFVFKQKLDPSYRMPPSLDTQETHMNQSDAVVPADHQLEPVPEKSIQTSTDGSAKSSKSEAFSFRASKFTIKVKLLTIITGILVVSLSVMIFLASGFFREDSQARISENNLNLATVIGSQVESELQGIGYKSNLLALTIDQSIGTPAEQRLFIDLFFEDNPEFIFLAIAEGAGGGLRIKRRLYNDKYLTENESLDRAKLLNVENESLAVFAKSLNGAFVVHNASVDVPLIALSQPLGKAIMILYLDPVKFLKAFQTAGIVETFMVNDQGDVIAHSDSRIVLSRANFIEKPIIDALLKSPVPQGQSQYEDAGVNYLGSFRKLNLGGLGIVSTVRTSKAFEAVDNIQRRNLLIMGIVLIIAFLIVYFFSNTLSNPIVRLVEGNQLVRDGNFKVNIPPTTKDEVGILTDSFNSMVVGLDAFTKFVNKEVAELALQGDIKLGGETKEAAVFFSDLRGFTAMSENMTPEEVVAFLNEYFTGMVGCVEDTSGIVDKFIGDAVMAHWGAFKSEGNNTENAINAALMMRASITEFNVRLKERAERDGTKFVRAKMGCGINTGPVVVGQIGSETRLECTVIGDAVNLASRIETLNKPFRTDVLISQDSYDLVRETFAVEAMPSIKVKGKTEPQAIYAVLGRKDDPKCPANMDEVRVLLGFETGSVADVDPDAKEEKFEVIGG
ncbi:MAG: HAMP domain-containing protein [bacterium]|nr:HAMP domain-containing protein [bacterium]